VSNVTIQRRVIVASTLVICPVISGLFFGLIAALLVLQSGGVGRASAVGALVGGVMFASNAVALCIVHSAAREIPERPEQLREQRRPAAHAS
jgi:hypothetical protein